MIRPRKIGQRVLQARLLRPVAMFTQALQIEQLVAPAVFLRDNVIDIRVRLPNLFAASGASVPPVIRFITREPIISITHQLISITCCSRREGGCPKPTTPQPQRVVRRKCRKFLLDKQKKFRQKIFQTFERIFSRRAEQPSKMSR